MGKVVSVALVVLLSVVLGACGAAQSDENSRSRASATPVKDTDADGIADARDPDPYSALNVSETQRRLRAVRDKAERERRAEAAEAARRAKARAAFTACDANIRVRATNTTCGFGQNAFFTYWSARDAGNIPNPLPVYSPKANDVFATTCRGSTKVVCRAEDGGEVRFSMSAVLAYTSAQAQRYFAEHDVGPATGGGVCSYNKRFCAPWDERSPDYDPDYAPDEYAPEASAPAEPESLYNPDSSGPSYPLDDDYSDGDGARNGEL
jgi:hypothetical protein